MKFLFPVCLILSTTIVADDVNFDWSIRAGGTGNDKIRGIAADENGDVFVTGEISADTDFGDENIEGTGKLDFVVAKIDPKGRLLWVSHAGGEGIDRGYAVSPTGDGGCFVTGHFESATLKFGDIELKSTGDYDGFTARFDDAGKCMWASRFGGANYDFGHGISTAPDGSVVMAGTVANVGELEGEAVGAEKIRSAVLANYSADGKLIWVESVKSSGISGHNVTVGKDGAVLLCGLVRGKAQWSKEVETKTRLGDVFVAKYTAAGEFEWVRTAGGESDGLATAVAVDEVSGNVLISGMFKGTAKFGDAEFTSRGGHDFYAATFSPSGEILKAHHGGGEKTDYGLSNVAIPGGGFAMTGEVSVKADFGEKIHVSNGDRDSYVATFSGSGELEKFSLVGGIDHDLSYAIAATSDGALIISGAFRNETQFGETNLKSKKANDIFVSKLRFSK